MQPFVDTLVIFNRMMMWVFLLFFLGLFVVGGQRAFHRLSVYIACYASVIIVTMTVPVFSAGFLLSAPDYISHLRRCRWTLERMIATFISVCIKR
jgi:hypothetical protein